MNQPKRILVIRNDKIGDFMLAWPAFSLLKKQYPDSEITALVPEYTAPLAEQCEWIDRILIDSKNQASCIKDVLSLSKNIKAHKYDVSISLFSEARTSIALWLAGIKTRIGPASKLAQLFLNKKLRQKRSLSLKPEYEYNLDLVKHYIRLNNDSPVDIPPPPYLSFRQNEVRPLKDKLIKEKAIADDSRIIIIHPGTGGSAINLSLEQYAELIDNIARQSNAYFVITAGPGEIQIAEKLSNLLKETKHHIHSSTVGIIDFCKYISIADVFISGSTGPLHLAGALNLQTAAFYPARQSATSLRWQTLNSTDKRLSFSPENYTGENDMQQIDIEKSAKAIIEMFLS